MTLKLSRSRSIKLSRSRSTKRVDNADKQKLNSAASNNVSKKDEVRDEQNGGLTDDCQREGAEDYDADCGIFSCWDMYEPEADGAPVDKGRDEPEPEQGEIEMTRSFFQRSKSTKTSPKDNPTEPKMDKKSRKAAKKEARKKAKIEAAEAKKLAKKEAKEAVKARKKAKIAAAKSKKLAKKQAKEAGKARKKAKIEAAYARKAAQAKVKKAEEARKKQEKLQEVNLALLKFQAKQIIQEDDTASLVARKQAHIQKDLAQFFYEQQEEHEQLVAEENEAKKLVEKLEHKENMLKARDIQADFLAKRKRGVTLADTPSFSASETSTLYDDDDDEDLDLITVLTGGIGLGLGLNGDSMEEYDETIYENSSDELPSVNLKSNASDANIPFS